MGCRIVGAIYVLLVFIDLLVCVSSLVYDIYLCGEYDHRSRISNHHHHQHHHNHVANAKRPIAFASERVRVSVWLNSEHDTKWLWSK